MNTESARDILTGTPEGRRFTRHIDSFTFECSSPEDTHLSEEEATTENFIQLRSGNQYRKRIQSVPTGSSTSEFSPSISITSSEYQKLELINRVNKLKNRKICKMTDLAKINQIIYHSIPTLCADIGPNLSQEVNTFLKCCSHVNSSLTDEEKKLFLRLLPTRFRGRALAELEGVEYRNLDELKTTITEKFINTKPYFTLVNELRIARQVPGETLLSFANRVHQLLASCKEKAKTRHQTGAEAVEEDLEETAIFAFKSGILDPNHRLFLLTSNEKVFSALLIKVKQLEEAETCITNFNNFNPNFNNSLQQKQITLHLRINTTTNTKLIIATIIITQIIISTITITPIIIIHLIIIHLIRTPLQGVTTILT